MKDLHLIAALKTDKEDALRDIFHLHFNKLHSFATEFIIDREIAREIVHDSILRFWQHRHHLNDETNIRAYLLKIVRNLCLNYLKKVKDDPLVIKTEDEIKRELDLNYEVLSDVNWDSVLVNEFEDVLKQIINSLPEKCRRIFELSRYENLSNLEISQNLNISIKTVEGHITEALKILRHKLSKYLTILLCLLLP